MRKRMRAAVVAAGCVAVLGSSVGVAATWSPARAETANCASAMNSQGHRCFSPTFSVGSTVLSVSSRRTLGDTAFVSDYVYAGDITDQDFNTMCVPGTGCYKFEIELQPNGAEFSPPRCLQASSDSINAWFSVAECDSANGLQSFVAISQPAGCFEWKLAGSSPALAVTANEADFTLSAQLWSGDVRQCVYRTD